MRLERRKELWSSDAVCCRNRLEKRRVRESRLMRHKALFLSSGTSPKASSSLLVMAVSVSLRFGQFLVRCLVLQPFICSAMQEWSASSFSVSSRCLESALAFHTRADLKFFARTKSVFDIFGTFTLAKSLINCNSTTSLMKTHHALQLLYERRTPFEIASWVFQASPPFQHTSTHSPNCLHCSLHFERDWLSSGYWCHS